MSGHNKWAGIKHRKAAVDKKKGAAFSKAAKAIISAVKQGGPDPEANIKLKYAIETAREVNMPRDNIERAIKRGAGDGEGDHYEDLVYEGYGPGKVAVYIEVLTDNRHRTAPEMRKLFDRFGGSLGDSGSVLYMFTQRAVIRLPAAGMNEDRAMEVALDAGAENYELEGDTWVLTAPPAQFAGMRQALEKAKITPASSAIMMVPNMNTTLKDVDTAQRFVKFLDALEENDDVQNVYSTVLIPDEIGEKLEDT